MSATKWTIDPAHSLIEFSVKHMMFTTVRGKFPAVEGVVHLDTENSEASSVEVRIEAAGIDTGVEDRDTHLRSSDFFDAEQHPHISFRSTKLSGSLVEGGTFQVSGELTIRGVAREVVLEATFEGTGKDPWGGTRAGFSASTTIDRRDFDLTWNQALETGGLLVGHEVKIGLQIQVVQTQLPGAST